VGFRIESVLFHQAGDTGELGVVGFLLGGVAAEYGPECFMGYNMGYIFWA
jgi:hypothetical protein